jgi:hypothetical protein
MATSAIRITIGSDARAARKLDPSHTYYVESGDDIYASLDSEPSVSNNLATYAATETIDLDDAFYVRSAGSTVLCIVERPLVLESLTTTGTVIAAAGIGVGNTVAGDTLGTVVGSVQIFDATGASLGYFALYDEITVTP